MIVVCFQLPETLWAFCTDLVVLHWLLALKHSARFFNAYFDTNDGATTNFFKWQRKEEKEEKSTAETRWKFLDKLGMKRFND